MPRILIVEDDDRIRIALRLMFEGEGFVVDDAPSGEVGVALFNRMASDVAIVDIMLPAMTGFETCLALRASSDIPIVIVSARDDTADVVLGLESGADDYVTKPFGMQELEARLRVALRHSAARDPSSAPATLTVGPIHVDVASRTVKVGGSAIELTAREFDLLAYLARNAGKVCTHRTILREVWGPGYGNETHYLRVYASRLRRKLGDEGGPLLRTNPGVGYQLVDERPTQPPGAGGGGAPGHCGDEPPGSVRGAPGHGGGEPPGAGGAEPPDGDGHPEGRNSGPPEP